jgi:hypothetical protein
MDFRKALEFRDIISQLIMFHPEVMIRWQNETLKFYQGSNEHEHVEVDRIPLPP